MNTSPATAIKSDGEMAITAGHTLLRLTTGGLIFVVHGWHKMTGGLEYWQHGTGWPLLEDIHVMHLPAPVFQAWAATVVQLVCPLFLMVGCFTRANALLLVAVLGGAVLQNVLAARDPQLAFLYLLLVFTLLIMGGGKWSWDAWQASAKPRKENK